MILMWYGDSIKFIMTMKLDFIHNITYRNILCSSYVHIKWFFCAPMTYYAIDLLRQWRILKILGLCCAGGVEF